MSGTAPSTATIGQPPARGCDRVALSRVGLLPDPHRVQLFLERRPIDDLGRTKLVPHHFVHGFLRSLLAQVRDMRSTGGLRGLKHDFMLAKHSYGVPPRIITKGMNARARVTVPRRELTRLRGSTHIFSPGNSLACFTQAAS